MTDVSDRIIALSSYAWNDWAITAGERAQILSLLRQDTQMPGTLRALDAAGYLPRIFTAFIDAGEAERLVQVLGAGAGPAAGVVEQFRYWRPRQLYLFRVARDLHTNYRQLDARLAATSFNPLAASSVVPSGEGADRAPFGGVGATGVPATQLNIPLSDQAWMFVGDDETLARYKNPVGSLTAYLDGLSPAQRLAQARRLVIQPINSIVPHSYLRGRPSRADVFRAAGRYYRLQPALIAAFILAEQRDQSQNEDAADYRGATHPIAQRNSSIGLGQVVVSTARNNDLFDRLLGTVRRSLGHNDIAELLVSEEFNIFAVAKYLRQVADQAANSRTPQMLPTTVRTYPGLDLRAYARPSEAWPPDNIRALGSEYTSKPWDDAVFANWGEFVWQAFRDMNGTGLFG